mgnify:CR=1 FL=1
MKQKYDPINLLRKVYSKANHSIKEEGDFLIFENNIKIEFKTQTAWKPPGQEKIYSIGDLYVFLKNKREKKSNVEYMMSIRKYKKSFQVLLISREHMKDIEE